MIFLVWLVLSIVTGTENAIAQEPMPKGYCDGEPNKADCATVYRLCLSGSQDSSCVNDVTYCLLHYDAEMCRAVQQNRVQEEIAKSWQFCIQDAVTRTDAQICIDGEAACIRQYYNRGRWVDADRNAAAIQMSNCTIAAAMKYKQRDGRVGIATPLR